MKIIFPMLTLVMMQSVISGNGFLGTEMDGKSASTAALGESSFVHDFSI